MSRQPKEQRSSSPGNVYESFAQHFSTTRYKRWPQVQAFLSQYSIPDLNAPPASGEGPACPHFGVDFGCGNGKNMAKENMLGLDTCHEFTRICSVERGLQVLASDVQSSGLRPRVADFVVCVAVLHHLASREGRLGAVREMLRVLVPGGRCLLVVWALDEMLDERDLGTYTGRGPPGSASEEHRTASSGTTCLANTSVRKHKALTRLNEQDVLVPWASSQGTTIENRFYHLFKRGELEGLVEEATVCTEHGESTGFVVEHGGFDKDNWFCVARSTGEGV